MSTFTLKPYQEAPSQRCTELLTQHKSFLLLGQTGCGKTFVLSHIAASLAKQEPDLDDLDSLLDEDQDEHGFRFLALTPKPVRQQFQRVAIQAGVFPHVMDLLTYEEIASNKGKRYIEWESKTNPETGELDLTPRWIEANRPDVLLLDECQRVKNDNTLAAKIVREFVLLGGKVVFTSATPFYKLAETKLLCYALLGWSYDKHASYMTGIVGPMIKLSKASETGSKRFREYLEKKGVFVEITGVTFSHKAYTHNKLLELDAKQRPIYEEAFNEWLLARREAEQAPYASAWAEEQAAMIKFQQIAEMLRARDLAKDAVEWVKKGKQVLLGVKYKETLEVVSQLLTEQLGVQRNKLSTLVGRQSEKVRQLQIDEFQSGQRDILLMTQATGKLGLSLDHDGTFDEQKPRVVLGAVVWSPIDIVQFLGRAHRANTCSTTHQYFYWFKDTIEESVAAVCSNGVKAISKLSKDRTDWIRIYERKQAKEVFDAVEEMSEVEVNELLELDSEGEEKEIAA